MADAPDPLEPLEPDPVTVQAIRDCYRFLGTIKGNVKLQPCDNDEVLDFDGTKMEFQKCNYQVECVVVSAVDGSLDKWLDTKKSIELFDEGDMRPILRNMLSQLVGLVQSIIAQKKCPTDLSMEDLYIKRLSGDIPKLQVLILNDGATTPRLLSDLLFHGRKYAMYNKEYANDYVRLLRNSYKHFNPLPKHIKELLGGNTDGLLRQIEEWSPRIWHILYVALHMP
ncbi:hypothetical protein D1007_37823 [Hordeum vulgare]|nr:hypothetical protein D1007_37823 [Hordeum vulgare]